MTRRAVWALVALSTLLASCGTIGLGEAECSPRDTSAATSLNVQAVPSARYTPCLNELRLGWDEVDFFAEDGRAGIRISRSFTPFLTATVTESCDVKNALPVDSGRPDIDRYEDVSFQRAEVGITIIPSGENPLIHARTLATAFAGVELDDRPVVFTIDEHLEQQITSRSNLALLRDQYVWIIEETDVEENTLDLRSSLPRVEARGLSADEALDRIEASLPSVFYRGAWYFRFDGGCITYDFDAKGTLAETVAEDAEQVLGFYPAYELRRGAQDAGFDVGGNVGNGG